MANQNRPYESEEWRDIHGYEGLYQVSSYGRVRSLNYSNTGKVQVMKPRETHGYKRIQLKKSGSIYDLAIHRLVAIAFIPKIDGKECIDHIDGDPLNNHVGNLRWCTHKDNMNNPITRERIRNAMRGEHNPFYGKSHKLSTKRLFSLYASDRIGNKNPFFGKHHSETAKNKISESRKQSGIPIVQYALDGTYIRDWPSAKVAARELGISSNSSITECCRGKRRTIGGFQWKYKSSINK